MIHHCELAAIQEAIAEAGELPKTVAIIGMMGVLGGDLQRTAEILLAAMGADGLVEEVELGGNTVVRATDKLRDLVRSNNETMSRREPQEKSDEDLLREFMGSLDE